MKNHLITSLVLVSMLMPALMVSPMNQTVDATDLNHTVFAEYASTTGCGYCPEASLALYSIYESGEYPFYYVSLVADKNDVANNRCYHYRAVAVPSVYFDGGAKNITGAVNQGTYRSMIQSCGERSIHNLDVDMTATEMGNAKIRLSITVKNNDLSFYIGGLLTYITEITSRWNDAGGQPYHFACIDIAVKRPVILLPKGSRTYTVTWDGAAAGFGDINYDNIMAISSVCHWKPHQEVGYNDKAFTAFYVDQTAGATVS